MSFGQGSPGLARFGWAFAVAAFFVAACGTSSDGGDDESDDDGGGGTSAGGGTGGAPGTGGAMSTGGTSSLSSQCAIFCQRTVACPDPEHQPCQENCESSADDAASLGCSPEYQRALDCLATVADPCAANACEDELATLFDCVADGGGMAGCAPTGTGPANADCVAICESVQACSNTMGTSDCATSCADGAAQAEMTGCTLEYQRINGCMSTCTNVCAFTTADCSVEIAAYTDCIVCALDPSNPNCAM